MPKKATFVSLSPFLAQSSYNPWNFLKEESYQSVFYYVNEAAFGPHLRMGVGCLDNQPCELSVPPQGTPELLGEEMGWMLNRLSP